MSFFQALADILDTPEGVERCRKFMLKIQNENKIVASQLDRFCDKMDNVAKFNEFVEKVIHKYESDEYYYRYRNRGLMASNDLEFFLYEYAKKFGTEIEDGIFEINGWRFEKICGQGCFVQIDKIN